MRRLVGFLALALLFISSPAWAQRSALTHTAVSVATTTTSVLVSNTSRNYLLIQNDGANTIYCKFNAAAVANQGIRLDPVVAASAGGANTREWVDKFSAQSLNCLALTGATNLLVTEGNRTP